MIELPECYVLAEQINRSLAGKTIVKAAANVSPHAFALYAGDPASYDAMLAGKTLTSANPGTEHTCGGNTEILCGDMLLVISTPIRCHAPGSKLPAKHQLLLSFDDGSHLSCTVVMWGAMLCYPANGATPPEGYVCRRCPDPLTDGFDKAYFDALWESTKPGISAKALLATEQRIPGLGNGVLQDILFRAGVHPKRKRQTMDDEQRQRLFDSVKSTLRDMREQGGRDTEKDLFGRPGGYRTLLSAKTLAYPCPVCGGALARESYLGGNVYFCPLCQPL